MGLPVLHRSSSCMHAVATTPAELQGALFAHFPCNVSLPRNYGGSASALRLSRPAQRSLALRPAYLPSHIMALYTGGFSRFVASTAAPIATGWSESCRAGFAPAGKPCLRTAHTSKHVRQTDNLMACGNPDGLNREPFLRTKVAHILSKSFSLAGRLVRRLQRFGSSDNPSAATRTLSRPGSGRAYCAYMSIF